MENLQQSELESTVKQQSSLLSRQQTTLEDLQKELLSERLCHANTNKELQEQVEGLRQQLTNNKYQKDADDVADLQLQLQDALKEKELVVAENSRKTKEIELLRQQSVSRTTTSSWNADGINKSSNDVMSVIVALEEETNRLRTELHKNEEEKMDCLKENVNLGKQISSLKMVVEGMDGEKSSLKSQCRDLEREAQKLKSDNIQLQDKCSSQLVQINQLSSQIQLIKKENNEYSKFISKVKSKLKEGECKVLESVKVAEDAVLEKDAALLREKHALNEINRLEKKIEQFNVDVKSRAEVAVNKVKDDYNSSIKNMSHEVVNLEMNVNEKLLEIERRKKQETKMENELKLYVKENEELKETNSMMTSQLKQRIQDQENTITRISKERDSLLSKSKMQIQREEEEMEATHKTLLQLQKELLQIRNEKSAINLKNLQLQKENVALSHQIQDEKREFEKNINHYTKLLRQKSEEIDLVKLQATKHVAEVESSLIDEIDQLNGNISALQEANTSLQALYDDSKVEYESKLSIQVNRFQDLTKKLQSSSKSLLESNRKLAISESKTAQYEKRISEIESRLHTAEKRFSELKA